LIWVRGFTAPLRPLGCAIILATVISTQARAQAPINSDVALQPSEGHFIVRQQFRYSEADFNKGGADLDIQLLTSSTAVVYGVRENFTLLLNVPTVVSRRIENNATGTSDTEGGLADLTALGKLRLYRNDFGPTNTARIDLLGGMELPTGTDAFSSDSVDPIVGGVATVTYGRHYMSADLLWKFNTAGGSKGEDLLRYDAAYIYRLWPNEYKVGQLNQFNGVIEFNGFHWTDGDDELFLSPGIQYVARRWIAEATVQLPVWQDLDSRPEREFIVGLSFRFQF
jgi:hypothetical protein